LQKTFHRDVFGLGCPAMLRRGGLFSKSVSQNQKA